MLYEVTRKKLFDGRIAGARGQLEKVVDKEG